MAGDKLVTQFEWKYFFQLQEKYSGSARNLEGEQVWVAKVSQRRILQSRVGSAAWYSWPRTPAGDRPSLSETEAKLLYRKREAWNSVHLLMEGKHLIIFCCVENKNSSEW